MTYGAGALSMINTIATAYAEKSLLVVISGAPGAAESAMGLGLHHQVKHLDSQRLVMKEGTAAQCLLDDADAAPSEIARVLSVARNQSLPVYIEFPRDMIDAEAGAVPAYSCVWRELLRGRRNNREQPRAAPKYALLIRMEHLKWPKTLATKKILSIWFVSD